MAKFNPPENFDFAQPGEWPAWRQRFARYRIATKLTKETEIVQISSLIYAMGKEAEHIFNSFTFEEGEGEKFDSVLRKFDEHFVPKRNVIHERARFHQRTQKPGEGVETFIRHLYEFAETCEFGALKDEAIRDRLVIGISDKQVSEKMQLQSGLNLEQAKQMARETELVKSQVRNQDVKDIEELRTRRTFNSGGGRKRGHVRNNTGQPRRGHHQWSKGQSQGHTQHVPHERQQNSCTRCGLFHNRRCPASGKTCHNCKRTGHFATMCRSGRGQGDINSVDSVNTPEATLESSFNEFFIGSIDCEDDSQAWLVTLYVQDTPVEFKIDTGADITVISRETYEKLNSPPQVATSG